MVVSSWGRGDVDVREGTWRPPLLVVLEFPSIDDARAWYESDEYRELRRISQEGSASDLILVDGLEY